MMKPARLLALVALVALAGVAAGEEALRPEPELSRRLLNAT
jgi:hypothetical protein